MSYLEKLENWNIHRLYMNFAFKINDLARSRQRSISGINANFWNANLEQTLCIFQAFQFSFQLEQSLERLEQISREGETLT
jgi:hypothetical protein